MMYHRQHAVELKPGSPHQQLLRSSDTIGLISAGSAKCPLDVIKTGVDVCVCGGGGGVGV
jgi:hypothetical protein